MESLHADLFIPGGLGLVCPLASVPVPDRYCIARSLTSSPTPPPVGVDGELGATGGRGVDAGVVVDATGGRGVDVGVVVDATGVVVDVTGGRCVDATGVVVDVTGGRCVDAGVVVGDDVDVGGAGAGAGLC